MVKKQEHSKELIKAFAPIKFFLVIIGQMPFEIKKKKDNTYSFKLNFKNKSIYIFLIFFTMNSMAYIFVTTGILTFMMNSLFKSWTNPTYIVVTTDAESQVQVRLWERVIVQQEMSNILVVWSWMTVAFAGSLYVLLNGKFYVHYMNYFNRVVQLVDMDMTPGIRRYLWKQNFISIVTAASLIVGYVLQFVGFHPVGNTASAIANFIFRIFGLEMKKLDEQGFYACQSFGFFIMLLALVGSRANVIQFLFFSQLLKNGATIWNQRFVKTLEVDQKELQEIDEGKADQFHRRLELKQILKDHLMLVQLFHMTDSVFGSTLLIHYCFQIMSVVMALYKLASLGGFDNGQSNSNKTDTPVDINQEAISADPLQEFETLSTAIVSLGIIVLNIWFAVSATTDAAAAYEQAMEGFHILRAHGFMYCRNKTDRNFVLTMFISFSKSSPMQLSADGYFPINKALLVSMAATIVTWAVTIYQTKVDQWK